MSDEASNEPAITVTLDDDIAEWLDGLAEDGDHEQAVRSLLAAQHAVAEDEEPAPVADLREEFSGLIDDVRDRVIQVKREADSKADAERLDDLDERLDDLGDELAELDEDVETIRTGAETLERQVRSGFGSVEDALADIAETARDLDDQMETLAQAVLATREDVQRLSARESAREKAEDLQAEANRHGFRTAECEQCESAVDIGLLSEPNCPHCEATFGDVEPKESFFATNTLVTDTTPALSGTVEGVNDDLLSAADDSTSLDVDSEGLFDSFDDEPTAEADGDAPDDPTPSDDTDRDEVESA